MFTNTNIYINKHTYTYTYLSLVQYTFRFLGGSCLPLEWEPDAIFGQLAIKISPWQ